MVNQREIVICNGAGGKYVECDYFCDLIKIKLYKATGSVRIKHIGSDKRFQE